MKFGELIELHKNMLQGDSKNCDIKILLVMVSYVNSIWRSNGELHTHHYKMTAI